MKSWLYNEFRHCGVDYADTGLAEAYDKQHQKFRDYEKEVAHMLEFLSLDNTGEKTLIDLGCGTGATAIYAAKHFQKVFAVDVSEVMISLAKRKAAAEKIANIEFFNAGFLTYEHNFAPVDLVITKAAFHHLPDFWKQIALLRMNKMLKQGGALYIFDVVFDFPLEEYQTRIDNWIAGFEKAAGAEFKAEVETHIRDEFSTFGWVMEGMLAKAGFKIEKTATADGFVTEYYCIKI